MQLIDTHCHIAGEEFTSDLPEVISRAEKAGVTKLICVASGDGFKSCYDSLELARNHPNIWATAGVHPLDAETPLDEDRLLQLASDKIVVAVGETGLDYYYAPETKELQKEWLRLHIKVAKITKKPLIIHARESASDCLQILQEMQADTVGGVFHCYAEDAKFAEALAEINFLVSFTGILTFKKAIELQKAAQSIPLNQIMLETDSPYLAPIPYRGKRCEPAYVYEIAKFLAELKDLSLDEIAETTTNTAIEFFKLSK